MNNDINLITVTNNQQLSMEELIEWFSSASGDSNSRLSLLTSRLVIAKEEFYDYLLSNGWKF